MIRKKRFKHIEWSVDTIGVYLLPLIGISKQSTGWSIWFGWLWFLFEYHLGEKNERIT